MHGGDWRSFLLLSLSLDPISPVSWVTWYQPCISAFPSSDPIPGELLGSTSSYLILASIQEAAGNTQKNISPCCIGEEVCGGRAKTESLERPVAAG